MFGATHSWSYTIRSILFEFYKMGHELFITSTDGYTFAQKEMSDSFGKDVDNADIDLCYTLPRNFKKWFNPTSKLKLAIFNWESTSFPKEWISHSNDLDYLLPSSSAVFDIFVENGWPTNKLRKVPLGVDWEHFKSASEIDIKDLRKTRFLNISIPHHRKNIDILLDAYYSAFKHDDNVSLILKSSFDKPKNKFECDLSEIIKTAQLKHRKVLPKVHVVVDKLLDIAPLYKAATCVVSTSSFEGFGLPMLEGLASGAQVIAPKISGQLDFLSDENSFLVNTNKISAGEKYQYWKPMDNSFTYLPKIDLVAQAMIDIADGARKESDDNLIHNFSWRNSAEKILEIHNDRLS